MPSEEEDDEEEEPDCVDMDVLRCQPAAVEVTEEQSDDINPLANRDYSREYGLRGCPEEDEDLLSGFDRAMDDLIQEWYEDLPSAPSLIGTLHHEDCQSASKRQCRDPF